MNPYIYITDDGINNSIQSALEETLAWLTANHEDFSWLNRTGMMEKSLLFNKIDEESWEFVVNCKYAGAVDYWKPYIDILNDHIEEVLKERLEQYFNKG